MARSGITLRTEFNRLPDLQAALPQRTGRVVAQIAHELEADIKERMDEPKSGRWYGAHQASAPGEAPAIDDGQLVNSVQAQQIGPFAWQVATNQAQAPVLEFGGAGVEARPSFGPAAEAALPVLEQRLAQLLDKV